MNCFAEPLGDGVVILRCGPEALAYGDPWEFSTVALLRSRCATLKALSREGFAYPDHVAIRSWLDRNGFWFGRYQRYKDGRSIPTVFISTPSFKELSMSESIKTAHAKATEALEALADVATGDVAARTTVLTAAHHQHLVTALGNDWDAQVDAGADVGHAAVALAKAGMAADPGPVHALIADAIEKVGEVAHAVHQHNMQQMKSHPLVTGA